MAVTFNGDTLRIILEPGKEQYDVGIDFYSEWKKWYKIGDNAKYPKLFRTVGGDTLSPTLTAGTYYFFQNQSGWRFSPPEEDIEITLSGNLVGEDNTVKLMVRTLGAFSVLIINLQEITQGTDALLVGIENSERWAKTAAALSA